MPNHTPTKDYFEVSLLEAARAVVWKLSHNLDLPGYRGPARIDRRDATIRQLVKAIEREETKDIFVCLKCGSPTTEKGHVKCGNRAEGRDTR